MGLLSSSRSRSNTTNNDSSQAQTSSFGDNYAAQGNLTITDGGIVKDALRSVEVGLSKALTFSGDVISEYSAQQQTEQQQSMDKVINAAMMLSGIYAAYKVLS